MLWKCSKTQVPVGYVSYDFRFNEEGNPTLGPKPAIQMARGPHMWLDETLTVHQADRQPTMAIVNLNLDDREVQQEDSGLAIILQPSRSAVDDREQMPQWAA
jgi:hypothetical protein